MSEGERHRGRNSLKKFGYYSLAAALATTGTTAIAMHHDKKAEFNKGIITTLPQDEYQKMLGVYSQTPVPVIQEGNTDPNILSQVRFSTNGSPIIATVQTSEKSSDDPTLHVLLGLVTDNVIAPVYKPNATTQEQQAEDARVNAAQRVYEIPIVQSSTSHSFLFDIDGLADGSHELKLLQDNQFPLDPKKISLSMATPNPNSEIAHAITYAPAIAIRKNTISDGCSVALTESDIDTISNACSPQFTLDANGKLPTSLREDTPLSAGVDVDKNTQGETLERNFLDFLMERSGTDPETLFGKYRRDDDLEWTTEQKRKDNASKINIIYQSPAHHTDYDTDPVKMGNQITLQVETNNNNFDLFSGDVNAYKGSIEKPPVWFTGVSEILPQGKGSESILSNDDHKWLSLDALRKKGVDTSYAYTKEPCHRPLRTVSIC